MPSAVRSTALVVFQADQHLHLLAPMIEGRVLTNQGLHTAHSRRRFGIHDVQIHIGRKLASMTSRTQVIGPFHPGRTDYGEHWFGT
jgi:uncharacterized protein (DUF2164 family)